ncbi:Transcriptional regulator, contains XRE-family HTH domain [Micromonospora purpureochromogenes]|uniref:Transcriptional regulator, contains XRE-family HTH domain n=1 Tax=Micromonospora purpureochromogenes TaxID=47872 RepID=A0A1C4VJ28_9ACTN|nr:helix-turn-helix transcriptional regulator [Micromonospora purpureochromogenes]SCE84004.1 Transcriptional regulator, contains XRE-family HTH domain [Micromonospora purpureochromogenes]
MASALDPPPTGPTVGQFPIAGLVRKARRIAGLGQRQMARFARVAPSTVGRVETGEMTPSLAVLERLLGAAGLYLAVVDPDGRVIQPMADWDDTRDGAGRRYPSHLDTILDPEPGEWWGDIYGLARPPETFHRCRSTGRPAGAAASGRCEWRSTATCRRRRTCGSGTETARRTWENPAGGPSPVRRTVSRRS